MVRSRGEAHRGASTQSYHGGEAMNLSVSSRGFEVEEKLGGGKRGSSAN